MLQHFRLNGRIGRGTWWLISFIPITAYAVALLGFAIPSLTGVILVLIAPVIVVMGWMVICANVRRYHDLGKSGWWIFICLIPLVGSIWQLIELGMIAGDEGENRFGSPGSSASDSSLLTLKGGREISGGQGVDLSKFDAQYFKERTEKMSAQPRTGMATAPRNTSGPVVFGKR